MSLIVILSIYHNADSNKIRNSKYSSLKLYIFIFPY